MDKSDKQMFAGIIATLVIWWFYAGRRRYSVKGMTRNG